MLFLAHGIMSFIARGKRSIAEREESSCPAAEASLPAILSLFLSLSRSLSLSLSLSLSFSLGNCMPYYWCFLSTPNYGILDLYLLDSSTKLRLPPQLYVRSQIFPQSTGTHLPPEVMPLFFPPENKF